jgi:hypothetical protein
MKGSRRKKEVKRNLLVSDFICRRCRVQATCENDHICGICQAIGKSSGPITENVSWRDIMLFTEITRETFLWLKKRNLVQVENKTL